jgi:hypothetical protein
MRIVRDRPAWRGVVVAALLTATAAGLAVAGLVATARQDVRSYVGPLGRIEFESVAPSLHHGICVYFRRVGVPEVSFAAWRLVPWRAVDVAM